MLSNRHTWRRTLVIVFILSGCGEDRVEVVDPVSPTAAAQIELCEQMCAKPLCSGVLEPAPDFEQQCTDACELTVSRVEERQCVEQYQSYLDCLDGLSCDATMQWFDQQPGYPCRSNEDTLAAECELDVRNAGG